MNRAMLTCPSFLGRFVLVSTRSRLSVRDRSAQPPWTPSLSVAFRMLIFVRFSAAIYTGIQDCDESGSSLSLDLFLTHPSADRTLCSPLLVSFQLLGAVALPRPQLRFPDVGGQPDLRHPKLGLHRCPLARGRDDPVLDVFGQGWSSCALRPPPPPASNADEHDTLTLHSSDKSSSPFGSCLLSRARSRRPSSTGRSSLTSMIELGATSSSQRFWRRACGLEALVRYPPNFEGTPVGC